MMLGKEMLLSISGPAVYTAELSVYVAMSGAVTAQDQTLPGIGYFDMLWWLGTGGSAIDGWKPTKIPFDIYGENGKVATGLSAKKISGPSDEVVMGHFVVRITYTV